jgi:hypothetical protein
MRLINIDEESYWSISRYPEAGDYAFKLVGQSAANLNEPRVEFYIDQRDFFSLCSVDGQIARIWPKPTTSNLLTLKFVNHLSAINFAMSFNKIFF